MAKSKTSTAKRPPADNPLLKPWTTPFGTPPFDTIRPEHFPPAFAETLALHKAEIAAIFGNAAKPSFDNTIAALEKSGQALDRVAAVFFNLTSADTNDVLQQIQRDIAPVLARHGSEISTNSALFQRIETLYQGRAGLRLSAEKLRVLELTRRNFVRSGAQLDAAGKARMTELSERLAALGTKFSQNVLTDESDYTMVLEGEADLAGLPQFVRTAAAEIAASRGQAGKHVITLSRSIIEPFLQFSQRRDLREKAYLAWTRRGENGGATDNREIIKEIVQLRAEWAKLLGFATFAHYKLDPTMAKTPEAVAKLLAEVWPAAKTRAEHERNDLQAHVQSEGGNFAVAPWDWRYYAEKVRKAKHDLNEADLKPYFPLPAMIEAVFYTAGRLFGLSFTPRRDIPVYHKDVQVWEVHRRGKLIGLFLGDYFARPSKKSGAWMSGFREQQKLIGDIQPIIINVLNFAKAPAGQPTLLSFDDVRTLFHEFGHALHGLLSNVTYPMIAGTSVPTDFVEFPSQLFEHWMSRPEILNTFARHFETGQPMPKALIDRLIAARNFNQGFMTVEYTASAIVDLELHLLKDTKKLDVTEFERKHLKKIGMPGQIGMRHRTPHFSHVFAGGGYAAGYYSYMWSEVLDADGFNAFTEAGNVFDRKAAGRLLKYVYSAGGLREPGAAYTEFRGRLPEVSALMQKRGLA